MRMLRAIVPACAIALASGVASGVVVPVGDTVSIASPAMASTSPWLSIPQTSPIGFPFAVRDAQNNEVLSAILSVSLAFDTPFQNPVIRYAIEDPEVVGTRGIVEVAFLGLGRQAIDAGRLTNLNPAIPWPVRATRSADGDVVAFEWDIPVPPPSGDFGSQVFFMFSSAPLIDMNGRMRITLNSGEQAIIEGIPVPTLGEDCTGDANGDGNVNFTDLNSVLTNFGGDCP